MLTALFLPMCRGLIAHYMQVKIREHILIHGDIRKTVETTVGGQTFEVEEFGTMEDAENDEGYQKVENGLDRRASFQLIGNRLKNNGQDVALAGSGDLEKNKGGPAAQDMELPAGAMALLILKLRLKPLEGLLAFAQLHRPQLATWMSNSILTSCFVSLLLVFSNRRCNGPPAEHADAHDDAADDAAAANDNAASEFYGQ